MSLKVVQAELEKTLTEQVALFDSGPYQIGLYKNDFTPAVDSDIGDITPANFSGYAGLQDLTSWASVVFIDPRASATHADVVWTHDGGGTPNDIYGYYVVDGSGNLAWAERNASAPVTISAAGQTYTVTPKYTRRSEF